jgi:hypothetical protein
VRGGTHVGDGNDADSDDVTQYDPEWDVEPEVKVPLWKRLTDKFVPKPALSFWLRTVDPDFASPPKNGRWVLRLEGGWAIVWSPPNRGW